MGETIQINFSRPIAVFPLANVVLLPHTLMPLRIFEPRYRQMLQEAMDSAGQIAMANFAADDVQHDYQTAPQLKPAVCVGQIVQHHRRSDEVHDVVLLGICRARIIEMDEPQGERLYRRAVLRPLEMHDEEATLGTVRSRLRGLLDTTHIRRMHTVAKIRGLFDREEVPTHALIELLGSELLGDPSRKYHLLAEPDPKRRAAYIASELKAIDRLIRAAEHGQPADKPPKGVSWN